jgi:hypothetical protein
VTIQAHASDADGVAHFEFTADDNLLGVVPAGGRRLGEASLEWQPPGPGVYLLGVRAEDTQGNQGAVVNVEITVAGTAAGADTPTESPTQATASEQCAAGSLVAPILLSPADGTTLEAPPLLAWSYPDPACHPSNYRVDIASDASFADISLGFGTQSYNETSRQWPLPAGSCYSWRVYAYVPDTDGPPSQAWTFCLGSLATFTPSAPTFLLSKDANCRLGPDTAYDPVDALPKGVSVAIQGRSEDSAWFWVLKPSGSGRCWVSASVGVASGSWLAVPVIAAPPLPATDTPPPADSTPPDLSELVANPGLVSAQTQCGSTPATTTVSARVTDASGIQRVVARVVGMGEFEMTPVGGGIYQAVVGPFGEAGAVSILVQAWDNAGNGAISAPLNVEVVTCPG